ncbi:hypothetical protein JTE90_028125 [Oedothorax gibbosus]|uniref:Uncharacterized protein n=1 Tax=Oedothorax gibbosus TaxID=931172 RepID=A0AAV6V8F3_9ARAC|nr:hypothetical protein JTE90_028125 [Oedothorax gibbosus]
MEKMDFHSVMETFAEAWVAANTPTPLTEAAEHGLINGPSNNNNGQANNNNVPNTSNAPVSGHNVPTIVNHIQQVDPSNGNIIYPHGSTSQPTFTILQEPPKNPDMDNSRASGRQSPNDSQSNFATLGDPRNHNKAQDLSGGKCLPVHCIIEQVPGPQACGQYVELDSYAIIPCDTLFSDLVRTALGKLGYSVSQILGAKGSIRIKKWKPLAFDQITENPEATVGDILGDLTTMAILHVRLYSVPDNPQEWKDTTVRNAVLELLREMSQIKLAKLCPLSQPMLSNIINNRYMGKIGKEKCQEFGQWYLTYRKEHPGPYQRGNKLYFAQKQVIPNETGVYRGANPPKNKEYHTENQPLPNFNYDRQTVSKPPCDERPIQLKGKGVKRRRVRNPEKWKENERKAKRTRGEAYITKKGKLVKAKELGEPCKCRRECHTKITEEERRIIFEEFYKLTSEGQDQLIANTCEEMKKMRRRPRQDSTESKRVFTRKYFLNVNKVKLEVCQTMYLRTLAISLKKVRVIVDKKRMSRLSVLPPEKRGKHGNHPKISEQTKNQIRTHIISFSAYRSQYCPEKTTKKYLLSPDLSLAKMYRFYSEQCFRDGTPPAKLWIYRKIFNDEFNFSFHPPKKDSSNKNDNSQKSTASTCGSRDAEKKAEYKTMQQQKMKEMQEQQMKALQEQQMKAMQQQQMKIAESGYIIYPLHDYRG